MACFLAPAAEAVVVTAITAAQKHHEKKLAAAEGKTFAQYDSELAENGIIRKSRKLSWLSGMLWGGSALLAFEHIWHGEVTPVFPFLTSGSLLEVATVGVGMAVAVTAVWAAVCVTAGKIARRAAE